MKERPILFSAPMVRAILEGRKTMTRRVMKQQPTSEPFVYSASLNRSMTKPVTVAIWDVGAESHACICPYGKPGDRLWVRETFAVVQKMDDNQMFVIDDSGHYIDEVWYRADGKEYCYLPSDSDEFRSAPPWKPSIHMPRWASRILLEVTDVRVERLRSITNDDARAEGAETAFAPDFLIQAEGGALCGSTWRHGFALLWQSINGPDSWALNPWVWVVSFRRIEASA